MAHCGGCGGTSCGPLDAPGVRGFPLAGGAGGGLALMSRQRESTGGTGSCESSETPFSEVVDYHVSIRRDVASSPTFARCRGGGMVVVF